MYTLLLKMCQNFLDQKHLMKKNLLCNLESNITISVFGADYICFCFIYVALVLYLIV